MRTSTKHAKEFEGMLTNFLGGLNRALPPHAVGQNELIDALNWFYDPATGYLTTRPGLKKNTTVAAGGSVIGIYDYVRAGTSKVLVVTEESPQELYYLDSDPKPVAVSGNLTGTKRPSFATINDVCAIATGGALQTYDQTNLATPGGGPSVDYISDQSKGSQNGAVARVLGCGNSTYRDRLFACGVNDITNWTYDTNEANAKYIDVGYKDGLDLIGIAQLMGYTVLFKKGPSATHRATYLANLKDDSQYWSCPRYRRMHSTRSAHLIAEVGDGILVVDVEGPKKITPAQQPTDNMPFKIDPAELKVAGEIAAAMQDDGFIIVDPVKMIAMIKPSKNHQYFYCMDMLRGRWTVFKFAVNIQCGAYVGGKMLFGASDGFIYEYDDDLYMDNGLPYSMTAETKWFNFFDLREEMTKEKYLDLIGIVDGSISFSVKKRGALQYQKSIDFSVGWWDWATVNALNVADWTEDLTKTPLATLFDDNNVESDFVSFVISVTAGRCSLSHLSARVAATGRE